MRLFQNWKCVHEATHIEHTFLLCTLHAKEEANHPPYSDGQMDVGVANVLAAAAVAAVRQANYNNSPSSVLASRLRPVPARLIHSSTSGGGF